MHSIRAVFVIHPGGQGKIFPKSSGDYALSLVDYVQGPPHSIRVYPGVELPLADRLKNICTSFDFFRIVAKNSPMIYSEPNPGLLGLFLVRIFILNYPHGLEKARKMWNMATLARPCRSTTPKQATPCERRSFETICDIKVSSVSARAPSACPLRVQGCLQMGP